MPTITRRMRRKTPRRRRRACATMRQWSCGGDCRSRSWRQSGRFSTPGPFTSVIDIEQDDDRAEHQSNAQSSGRGGRASAPRSERCHLSSLSLTALTIAGARMAGRGPVDQAARRTGRRDRSSEKPNSCLGGPVGCCAWARRCAGAADSAIIAAPPATASTSIEQRRHSRTGYGATGQPAAARANRAGSAALVSGTPATTGSIGIPARA